MISYAGQAIGEDGGFVSGHPNSKNCPHPRRLKILKIVVFKFLKIHFVYKIEILGSTHSAILHRS